mmetsp:Transcript_28277/g.42821  ORF Transcript_28277/g.42821 Transcript_28277/m.42821 type:complete len:135 (-) Transcript_28277:1865-2269(-)
MVAGGQKFLKDTLTKQGVIFGLIHKCNTKADNYVEVKIDDRNAKMFQGQSDEEVSNVFTRYCYYFESLLTNMREFRAIKQLEFTRLCPAITFPSLFLSDRDQMVEEYAETIEESFQDIDNGPTMLPREFDQDDA